MKDGATMKGIEGIKVVELAGYVAGPACPRILGEMGATIYKIEPPGGDEYRTNAPGFGMKKTDIDDPAFDLASMNKEWLSINLKDPDGKAIVYRMLQDADVLITNYRDKALKKLGFDYETIHKEFPSIVWAQMRGYGDRGDDKNKKGFDATAYGARGGLFASIPQAGEHYAPGNMPAAFGDWNAGLTLTAGILAALVRKDRTGLGDKVTVNLYHLACWGFQTGLAGTQFGDEWPKSRKNVRCPTNNTYYSQDGVWFLICYGSYNLFYNYVMEFIGRSDLLDDPRYFPQENMDDKRNSEIIAIIEEAFASKPWSYWQSVFVKKDVPYEKINTFKDILADPDVYKNDILRPIHYDAFGEKSLTTIPIRLESQGDPVLKRSKPIGYDTERVLVNDFGYSESDVRKLIKKGTLRCYEGPELPSSIFELSYGPNSI